MMGDLLHRRTVLLVDDHPLVLEALAERINEEPDLIVCAQAGTARGALQAIGTHHPNIILTDLSLPDGSGLELIKNVCAQTKSPVVVFSMFDDPSYALRALKAGAMGYISKHEPTGRIIAALRLVLRGERYVTPELSPALLGLALQPGSKSVTPEQCLADRELEVFELLGKGIGTREIAQRLGRSIKTIEAYRARIKRKLDLKDAPALMREAVRWIETRPN